MLAVKKGSTQQSLLQAVAMTHLESQAMLVSLPKRYYQMQRLHVNDTNFRNGYSGINATMFGGTSPLGSTFGGLITRMGSTVIYPYRTNAALWDNRFKELKPTADLGYKAYVKIPDMSSQAECRHAIKDSNVVVNVIGSNVWAKTDKDFEDANIRVPVAIAKAAKSSGKVKRLIHISAAGADPNSHSRRLRTKWLGEQEVKEIYPEVTILRPTYIFNILHPNITIAGKWGMQMKMFNRMNWQIEGMDSKVQPVFVNDVALAMLNCLKMEETIG